VASGTSETLRRQKGGSVTFQQFFTFSWFESKIDYFCFYLV
jgi:hypothetical protein